MEKHKGNAQKYAIENVKRLPDNILTGKRICYLGSSVTYGAASKGVSFVEYIAKRNGNEYTKEAVSGTTLVDCAPDSYIARLKKITNKEFDLFVCQLSTNDAAQGKTQGKPSFENEAPDTATICGAIEYIIRYARNAWNCPVLFYTNPFYENDNYATMVGMLHEIAEKYEIAVLDFYTDKKFNAVSAEKRALYMADHVHPTQAGYLEWWTPNMEKAFADFLSKKSLCE